MRRTLVLASAWLLPLLAVCWLLGFATSSWTNDTAHAAAGYLALFGLLGTVPLWILLVWATTLWVRSRAQSAGWSRNQRRGVVAGGVVMLVLHPLVALLVRGVVHA